MFQSIEQALRVAREHHERGRPAEARAACEWILARNPNHAAAWHQLGVLAAQTGQVDEAIALIRRAIEALPGEGSFHVNLGMILEGRGRMEEALASYRQAVKLNPGAADWHYKLGNALRAGGRMPEAMASYREAVRLNPVHAAALNNLGNCLKIEGRIAEASACLQAVLRLNPVDHGALVNLAGALGRLERHEESIACYRRALALKPDDAEVRGALVEAHSCRAYGALFDPGADARTISAALEEWSRLHAELHGTGTSPHDNDPTPERRLRIGYMSPNFRDHVVGRNVLPLLRNHDHGAFEVFCFSNSRGADGVTGTFRQLADHFQVIAGESDEQVAARIRKERIDILVDLNLHLDDHRLGVLARRPAPVQVTFAGYPGSTGLRTVDYRITDPYLDPPGEGDRVYAEKSRRLAGSFWCFDPLGEEPPIGELPALAHGSVTFGCLNYVRKINAGVVALWSRVLASVPHSRLMLLVNPGDHRQRTADCLVQHGIAPERIVFQGQCPRRQYLRLYDQIDLGLDTVPYNGHSTSLDSFFMGVPVVTLVGRTVVGRAGLSQLTNLGLPELIARTPEEYVRIAVELAGDLPRLGVLRHTLRGRMRNSPLMDGRGFARDIELLYREMWREWCAGRASSA